MGKKYLDTKKHSIESSILSVWQEASLKQEKLDAVNKNAVKKKFDDRKDKDIDNDGDTDDSDKFLHKKRKAISKAMKDEGNAFGKALKAAKENGEKTFVVSGKTYEVKEVADLEEWKTLNASRRVAGGDKRRTENKKVSKIEEDIPSMEIGTDRYRDHTLNVTPGETDPEWVAARDFKVASMKEALAKVWGLDEKKDDKEAYDEEDEELKPVKGSKTMTGGKTAKVDTKPKIG